MINIYCGWEYSESIKVRWVNIYFFIFLLSYYLPIFFPNSWKLEYRTDGSVLSASGGKGWQSLHKSVRQPWKCMIARFISGDNTYKRGASSLWGRWKHGISLFWLQQCLRDTHLLQGIGIYIRMKYYFMYDSAEYVIRLRLFENGKPA